MSLAETQNLEWSSMPVKAFCRGAVGKQEAVHDIELPQLHGCTSLPPFPGLPTPAPGRGVDDAGANQAAIHRRLRRRRLHAFPSQLEGDAPGSPIAVSSTHLQDHDLNCSWHLMRAMHRAMGTVVQPFQAVALVAGQPAVHGSPRDTPLAGHLTHRPTVGEHSLDCLISLLSHAHLPHARERDKSAEVAVTHQPKVCDTSADGLLGRVSRTCTIRWCRRGDSNPGPSV